jgi:hypothetical protein
LKSTTVEEILITTPMKNPKSSVRRDIRDVFLFTTVSCVDCESLGGRVTKFLLNTNWNGVKDGIEHITCLGDAPYRRSSDDLFSPKPSWAIISHLLSKRDKYLDK